MTTTSAADLVTPLINGVGPATRLGGLPLHEEVWQAMREASQTSLRMDELQAAVGARLASLLGVPAAYVTPGAHAAMTLGVAAAIAQRGDDPLAAISTGAPLEAVIQTAHSDPYDQAAVAAGARLVHVGYPTSAHPAELTAAITGRTAAVLYRPGRRGNLIDLPTTARIAHDAGLPVIVDGALFAPPVERLQSLFTDGADLVALSGGKGFRGPQASGLLCGDPDLLDSAAIQHQDMDERPQTWQRVLLGSGVPADPPRHGVGRGFKIGPEQVIGLLAAIERYQRAPGADDAPGIAELAVAEQRLYEHPGLTVTGEFNVALNVPELQLDVAESVGSVDDLVRRLAAGSPRVVLGEDDAWRRRLSINPMALRPGDGAALAAAISAALSTGGKG